MDGRNEKEFREKGGVAEKEIKRKKGRERER
jgi:hypothetical protein